MGSPADRTYSKTHEWHKFEGDTLTLGVTKFAVDALTDITYVQMKPVGTRVAAGGIVGEVESVKTTSDIYSAVAGEITAINPALSDNPGLLNSDPFGAGWLLKLRVTDKSGASALLDAAKYDSEIAH